MLKVNEPGYGARKGFISKVLAEEKSALRVACNDTNEFKTNASLQNQKAEVI
jgi:hypothetical protein